MTDINTQRRIKDLESKILALIEKEFDAKHQVKRYKLSIKIKFHSDIFTDAVCDNITIKSKAK